MLSVVQAESILQSLVKPFGEENSETIPLLECVGRILATPVHSPLDFPHWDNSAMDGYAVRYDDVDSATQAAPCSLAVVEEIAAGQIPGKAIAPGQAARIFTGAMLPDGADTIVMQENTKETQDGVSILEAPPQKGHFVRQRGAFHRAGDRLLPPGTRLGPADIAVLAAAQCSQVTVFRRPQVGILSTGNELVDPGQPLGPGQIVDSNRYALAAIAQQSGSVPHLLGRLPDHPEALRTAIEEAIANPNLDLVLSSGGVSVGDYDYVDQILEALGATLHIRAVAVKPGKPLTVATIPRPGAQDLLYFGLPGNPVSALVSFWRFVQPALRRLAGATDWHPQFVTATTQQPLKAGGKRETYLWGNLSWDKDGGRFAIAGGSHSSGNLVNLAQTNALAKLPVGTQKIEAGSLVEVLMLS